ncbi:hypothetical protein I4F81_011679 [Pyropia yezoensis]|uniref:Uncharacterized protein n=1 Tax=Pyropia yezoensis TaxID=2788 RepID=A0ACC3CGI1_PYRYE|nr:hypothetical protein I4F81_011679 [Neopyropia yezoensis]
MAVVATFGDGTMTPPLPPTTPEEEALKVRDGAIVWARLPGFPWWPATVRAVPPGPPKQRKRETDRWYVLTAAGG